MKKKLRLLLFALALSLFTIACGEDTAKKDYNGRSYEELNQNAVSLWESLQNVDREQLSGQIAYLESMSAPEREEYLAQSGNLKLYYNLMKAWNEIAGQVGDFASVGKFSVTQSGKTTTTELRINFSKRSVVLSEVYNSADMKAQDVTVDLVYSLAEKMQKAGLNTLMGMGTVFVMLIIISLLISCFRFIPLLEKKFAGKGKSEDMKEVLPPIAERETEEFNLELVAVMAAAVAAYSGKSADDFVVRSIKRRK